MVKPVRIQDVAAQAGVSVTTVSRYLNQRYEAMSDETRARIARVIDELGYRPNIHAQGLKGNRTRTVAAIVVNMGYPFCVGLIRALNHVLAEAGYSLFVSETGGDARRERDVIESACAQRVDGIILQTDGANNGLIAEVAKTVPVVFVDRIHRVPRTVNIATNNREASLSMTRHLFGVGYPRVAYVTEVEQGVRTRVDRRQGYEAACAEVGVEPFILTVDRGQPETFASAADRIGEALDGAQRTAGHTAVPHGDPSTRASDVRLAVYTANGLIMMQLYPYLRRLPVSVPDPLGLATFDEPDWAKLVQPTLTCVGQPVAEMGLRAGQVLLAQLESPSAPPTDAPVYEEIPSALVVGGSTLGGR
ncbi:MAG: LacI family transcriptional regulator [Alicyclobacillus sp.]|nr:LacI family transcriptional regulator [Alicyclobacillus sp.]